MPRLPSGLSLAISRDALIDHGDNWFKCPDGHFWFWVPAPEAGTPPYELGSEIMRVPEHAPVPSNREEVKRFILVLEMMENGHYGWRGEWLADFSRYAVLDDADTIAWKAWLDRPEILTFLDETIARCARMAEVARSAVGYVAGTVLEPGDEAQQQANGMWNGIKMNVWRDSKLAHRVGAPPLGSSATATTNAQRPSDCLLPPSVMIAPKRLRTYTAGISRAVWGSNQCPGNSDASPRSCRPMWRVTPA